MEDTSVKTHGSEWEQYNRLLEAVPDGVYMLDADSCFTSVNEGMVDLTGYAREELLGASVSLIVTDEVTRDISAQQAYLQGHPDDVLTAQYDVYTKSGTVVQAETRSRAVEFDETFGGTAGVIRPLSERRERQDDLFAKAQDIAGVGAWEYDVQEDEVFFTDEVFEIYGVDADFEPSPEQDITTFYHPDDQDTVREAIEQAFEAHEGYDIEVRITAADGTNKWVRTRSDADHEDQHVYRGTIQDITKRKQYELALESLHDAARELLNTKSTQEICAVIIDVVEETFDTLESSLYLLAGDTNEFVLTGYTAGLVAHCSEPVTHAISEGDSPVRDAFVNDDVLTVNDPATLEAICSPDEKTDSIQSGLLIPLGDHGVFTVLSPEPQLDDDTRNLVDLLAATAEAAFDRLENEAELREREQALKQINERLKESNARLEQFAHAASHDLQEPLRMISSYLQLIERRADDELTDETEEFLEYAVDGADRMRAMIDGLLSYSRVETEGDTLEPVDLNDVVTDVLNDLDMHISEHEADITTAELPRVLGDGRQLRQVFQNLVNNAIKYSGDEPPQVHICAERDGAEWHISVHDEGVGIEPAEHGQIFELFQRLNPHNSQTGSGIGLALCERIIERHGGDIWVVSEPGEGSTFSFTLPAADAPTR